MDNNIKKAIEIIIDLEFKFMDTDDKFSALGYDLTEFFASFVTTGVAGHTRAEAIAQLMGIDEHATGKSVYENLYDYRQAGQRDPDTIIGELLEYRAPDRNVLDNVPEENREAAAAILIEILRIEYKKIDELQNLGEKFDFSELTYSFTYTNGESLTDAIALILGMNDSGVVFDWIEAANREDIEDPYLIIEKLLECKDDSTEIIITRG